MIGHEVLLLEADMFTERIDIWKENEYSYKAAYGFVPNIRTYIHDDDEVRQAMLVVPGGGYCMVVPPEAEIVAKEFYNRGMNTFVLTYTTDITFSVPLKMQPLNDISRAVRLIRSRSDEFKIDVNQLAICGFSAGGHLCGSLCVHYDEVKDKDEKLEAFSNRPDAAILSYPVITTGDCGHGSSIEALLGKEPTAEELEFFSLEKNVTENTTPCFIWQTVTDDLVPVENSYLMAGALMKKGVPCSYHAFPSGHHGLSVATDDFFQGKFGEDYTFEQLKKATACVRDGNGIGVSEQRRQEIIEQFYGPDSMWFKEPEEGESSFGAKPSVNPFPDVKTWPDLAMIWMNRIFQK